MAAEVGHPAPDFELFDQHLSSVSLVGYRGQKLIVVFIPWPFSEICDAEACSVRDNLEEFRRSDAEVLMITCHPQPTTRHWAEEKGFDFPVLSDFWPHGAIASAYGCFDERFGVSRRATYVVDENGIVTDVIDSGSLGRPRAINEYTAAITGA